MIKTTQHGIGYDEKKKNLAVRIDTHKRYSTFSLEDWIGKSLSLKEGSYVLDLGCGNGNLFRAYSNKLGTTGLITGTDKSRELLEEAHKEKTGTPTLLLEWDLNNRLPFLDQTFDFAISSFAVYYVENAGMIVKEIYRVLKMSGEMILIGPTDNNAKELYEFDKKVFGHEPDRKAAIRTARIEKEFYLLAKEVFGNAIVDKIPSALAFPNKKEFIKYYKATLLFQESTEKAGFTPDEEKLYSIDTPSFNISKEMIVLRAKRHGQ